MAVTAPGLSVTLGELVAVLSLGVDLATGQPMEHVLRQSAIACELAARGGLGEQLSEAVSMTTLLAFVGCHADSYEQAKWFGDEIEMRGEVYETDMTPSAEARFVMGHLGGGQPALRRTRTVAGFMWSGRKTMDGMRAGHCFVAGKLAARLGLRDDVRESLQQVFERWDGHGDPQGLAGEEIGMPARLVQVAQVAEVFHRAGGVDAAVTMARARSGTQFDPAVVDLFCSDAAAVLATVDSGSSWQTLLTTQPGLAEPLAETRLAEALEAIADYMDLKSPYTLGHSRAVADIASEAARVSGLPTGEVQLIRSAALVHNFGRLGVTNAIWDKPEPLTTAERERIRLQPYLTGRMLSSSPGLAPLAELAATVQERLDGSGYPGGLRHDALSPSARMLAAADVYQALREPRAHREARDAAAAADELRDEVRAGRLDGDAVEAVLRAAGHKTSRRPTKPGGLTAREIDVLRLVARGLQSKEIADRLVITRKTVDHHIGHIYSKIGASNRVGASVFATEHGLLGSDQD